MSTKSRELALAKAFTARPILFQGKPLRPVTAGSLMLLMESGNPLFSDAATEEEMTEKDMLQGFYEFIHVHSAPEEEVVEDMENPAILGKKGKLVSLRLTAEELVEIMKDFADLRTRLEAATAEVIPEKSEGKQEAATTPPLTGSPTSSTPSAALAILPASDGLSGDSPSSEPSNIFTLPTLPTEPAPVGPSRNWEPDPTEMPPMEETPSNVIPLP
jgi:hypothetical protein